MIRITAEPGLLILRRLESTSPRFLPPAPLQAISAPAFAEGRLQRESTLTHIHEGLRQVIPFWIDRLNQLNLPRPIPFLQSLFRVDGLAWVRETVGINQAMHAILFW